MRDGRITFQGPRINDPALDVTAQRVIEPTGIEARIHIEGTAQRPQLRFSSNPPMDESDVIALIIFNRPLSDLDPASAAPSPTSRAPRSAGCSCHP